VFICFKFALSGLRGIAVSAVNRLIATRLKRDFGLLATAPAGRRKHLARASIIVTATFIPGTLGSSRGTASRTTFRLIGEALGSEEFLLFGSKGEGFSAVGTSEGFLSVSH